MCTIILYKTCTRSTERADEQIIVGLFAAVGGLVNMSCGSDVARGLETPAAE